MSCQKKTVYLLVKPEKGGMELIIWKPPTDFLPKENPVTRTKSKSVRQEVTSDSEETDEEVHIEAMESKGILARIPKFMFRRNDRARRGSHAIETSDYSQFAGEGTDRGRYDKKKLSKVRSEVRDKKTRKKKIRSEEISEPDENQEGSEPVSADTPRKADKKDTESESTSLAENKFKKSKEETSNEPTDKNRK